jgi:nucleotide-binding universal stress UspA family protein
MFTEPHEHPTNLIVVGLDESDAARAAAGWAAQEAARRHARLHLVSAYPISGHLSGVADIIPGVTQGDALSELQRTVQAELTAAHPGLTVTGAVVRDEPVALLLRESRHALMLVVATRSAGRLSHVAMGSVAFGVTARAHLPVVVIRPGVVETELEGPVVVGIDGSPISEQALAFAFAAASARHAPLLAVHAWDVDRAFDPAVPGAAGWSSVRDLEDVERVVLAERLAGWRERYPDVPVETSLLTERPAEALERLSKKAQLVVVGSRGRNRVSGMVLGSTSQHLIVHAGSPVAVIRPDEY